MSRCSPEGHRRYEIRLPLVAGGARHHGRPGRISRALCVLLCTTFATGVVHPQPNPAQIQKSVVRVYVEHGTGSGFIVHDDGFVATNEHVVDSSSSVLHVRISGQAERVEAELLWADPGLDLALLFAPGLPDRGGKSVTLASPPLEQFDEVFAVGFPGVADVLSDSETATASGGVVSKLKHEPWPGGTRALAIIQHTAAINPGNSGGPLFDACGAVVGVNTSGSFPQRATTSFLRPKSASWCPCCRISMSR